MLNSATSRNQIRDRKFGFPCHSGYRAFVVVGQFLLLLVFLASSPAARANDIYISQSGSGAGSSCSSPLSAAFFNNSSNWGTAAGQIGPGTTVHLCGTFTGAPNSVMLTFRGNGTSASPITVLFESGAQLNATYWSPNGAINMGGRSNVVVDGGTNGIIQNTANGDSLANRQITSLIYALTCNSCAIRNLTLANAYVAVRNQSTLGGPMTQMTAVIFSGSNWTISGNTIHDCGWCLLNTYGNGDANLNIHHNDIYNWDHAYTFATSGPNAGSNLQFHDNRIHDNLNFETQGCMYHLDGMHFFGTSGSSMSGIYVYNNYFYGTLSSCSTGFIFMEGGSGTPSHASNTYWWNNVFDATGTDGPNPNGWVGIFSGDNGVTQFVNNTFIYTNAADNTNCYNIGSVNNLTFQGNVVNGCNVGVNLGSLSNTPASQIDYNFYGGACATSNNCFVYNRSFTGSFSTYRSLSGFDAHSKTSTFSGALLNADGSPQSGSPVRSSSLNLTLASVANLLSLSKDTTRGGARSPIARPLSGLWDMGAYQYGTASSSASLPAAPTGLTASVQ
jgi:hypothetical protein